MLYGKKLKECKLEFNKRVSTIGKIMNSELNSEKSNFNVKDSKSKQELFNKVLKKFAAIFTSVSIVSSFTGCETIDKIENNNKDNTSISTTVNSKYNAENEDNIDTIESNENSICLMSKPNSTDKISEISVGETVSINLGSDVVQDENGVIWVRIRGKNNCYGWTDNVNINVKSIKENSDIFLSENEKITVSNSIGMISNYVIDYKNNKVYFFINSDESYILADKTLVYTNLENVEGSAYIKLKEKSEQFINIYSDPDLNSKIVGNIADGVIIDASNLGKEAIDENKENQFVEYNYNGIHGWVCKKYLDGYMCKLNLDGEEVFYKGSTFGCDGTFNEILCIDKESGRIKSKTYSNEEDSDVTLNDINNSENIIKKEYIINTSNNTSMYRFYNLDTIFEIMDYQKSVSNEKNLSEYKLNTSSEQYIRDESNMNFRLITEDDLIYFDENEKSKWIDGAEWKNGLCVHFNEKGQLILVDGYIMVKDINDNEYFMKSNEINAEEKEEQLDR